MGPACCRNDRVGKHASFGGKLGDTDRLRFQRLFPWSPVAFGEGSSNGPIDYNVLTLNWSANALQCAQFEQSLVLHLDSESSTTTSSWYCGPQLRIISTVVDSERTSVPVQSQVAYQELLMQCKTRKHTSFANSQTDFEGPQTIAFLSMFMPLPPRLFPAPLSCLCGWTVTTLCRD